MNYVINFLFFSFLSFLSFPFLSHSVIKRAIKGGLDKILITAGSYQETVEALKICEELDPKCELLFTTVGVHPTRTKVS